MAHLDMRRMWARGAHRICSPAWLTVHVGFYLTTGTALVLINALTAPADLWFWQPVVLLGVLLSVHGVATLIHCQAAWFKPAGALARSVWSHITAIRQALLVPAVSGIVAMPGLFSLGSNKSATNSDSAVTRRTEGLVPASAHRGQEREVAPPPSGWPAPTKSDQLAPVQPTSVPPALGFAAPVRPAYATWPSPQSPSSASESVKLWPAMTVPQTPSPAPVQSWPTAPTAQASVIDTDAAWAADDASSSRGSIWQTNPPRPASPAWSETWPAPAEAAPPVHSAPPRLIEQDSVLIGTRRTDPEYAPWAQLEDAASTWLARRASDLDAAESAT